MVTSKEEVYSILKDNNVEYELLEHDAVYTIDDMKLVEGMKIENVCKNLFLRDERGKKHFLVVISEEKSADLKDLREKLGTSRLGFASEERLMKYLGLIKGAVTPLGVLNDKECAVQVIFDKDLAGRESLGVHPCDNTATLFLSFDNLKKIIEGTGHTIKYLSLSHLQKKRCFSQRERRFYFANQPRFLVSKRHESRHISSTLLLAFHPSSLSALEASA